MIFPCSNEFTLTTKVILVKLALLRPRKKYHRGTNWMVGGNTVGLDVYDAAKHILLTVLETLGWIISASSSPSKGKRIRKDFMCFFNVFFYIFRNIHLYSGDVQKRSTTSVHIFLVVSIKHQIEFLFNFNDLTLGNSINYSLQVVVI